MEKTYAATQKYLGAAANYNAAGETGSELIMLTSVAKRIVMLTEVAVSEARQGGMSWSEIGDVLRISRQAAHQKYGATS